MNILKSLNLLSRKQMARKLGVPRHFMVVHRASIPCRRLGHRTVGYVEFEVVKWFREWVESKTENGR